jgi:hypothetical protein
MLPRINKRSFSIALTGAAFAALVACGGGSDPVVTTLSVTPVLGAVYGGTVTVYSNTGTLLGTATTSATDGKASVNLSNYTAGSPIVVKVNLAPGASYFNEKTGANVTITAANPISMLSVVPAVASGQAVGVTPITNMAAKLAGLTTDTVGTGTLATTVTADAIYTAVAKTNLALGLPATTNILAAPVAATVAAPKPTETLGNILAVMAKNTAAADPVTQANNLAAAVKTDGTVDSTKTAAITEVNTTLKDTTKATGVTIVIAAPVTAPTAAQVTTAAAATKTVVDAAKPTGAGG